MDDFGQDILLETVAEGVAQVHRAAQASRFYWQDVGTLDRHCRAQLDFIDAARAPFEPPMLIQRPSREALQAATHGTVLLPGARIGARARVHHAILGPGAVVPDGMLIGEDLDQDRRWFRVVADGTVLVTATMLARRREGLLAPKAIGWRLAPAEGR